MKRVAPCLLLVVFALHAAAGEPPQFPAGTARFFDVYAADAVPARNGGVWLALRDGIVRYSEAGRGAVLSTPEAPYRLALATDGSIWFAERSGVGRMSTSGTLLAHHTLASVADIAVATDGALWYSRARGSVVGRIQNGVAVEFTSPTDASSLAQADAGAVWILGSGFGTDSDSMYQMSSTGAVMPLPLSADVLFGRLQAVDRTVYIGTGYRNGLLRLAGLSTKPEIVSRFHDTMFLVDDAHGIWSATSWVLRYLAPDGVSGFSVELPYDPRAAECSSVAAYAYRPLAVDSDGGLWLRVFDDAFYFPEPIPCPLPPPPPMPTLIRIDGASLIAAQSVHDVPAMSPAFLGVLAATVLAIGMLRVRS